MDLTRGCGSIVHPRPIVDSISGLLFSIEPVGVSDVASSHVLREDESIGPYQPFIRPTMVTFTLCRRTMVSRMAATLEPK